MPGQAIGKVMNYGYPGSFARNGDCIIANRPVKSTDADGPAFGDPVILNTDNSYSKFGATGTAALFAGVAVREVKQADTYAAAGGKYLPGQPCDVIERGNVSVVCRVGTPVAGGAVYVRITANEAVTGSAVSGFEYRADDDSGKCILLTNCKWATGLKDSNNVTELSILTRNNP